MSFMHRSQERRNQLEAAGLVFHGNPGGRPSGKTNEECARPGANRDINKSWRCQRCGHLHPRYQLSCSD